MNVVITDCNYEPANPHPVFIELRRLLAEKGVHLTVDNCWSDDYAKAELIIGADPLLDGDVILDTRVLGQRTLNRYSRLKAAAEVNGPVPRFCSPANEAELFREAGDWGELAVLKYDWSMRRNGVFLWPLAKDRKPFPADFKQGADLFMEFLAGDPLTYKIDAFAGKILGSWILPTRHMQETDWQVISDPGVYWFDPPPETSEALGAVSEHLLGYGAGYVSFDLMRTDQGFRIIEINSCGVGTSVWRYWPERYAANYAQGILHALENLSRIPRYRALRAAALQHNNDAAAVQLKLRPKIATEHVSAPASDPSSETEVKDQISGERIFYEDLLRSETAPPRRLARTWQKAAELLLKHARKAAPFYADRLARVTKADGSIDWARWQEVAFISDQDIAENRERMLSRNLPSTVGAVTHARMTGQSGKPLTITRSAIQSVVESVIQARLYHWHKIEPTTAMATLLPRENTIQRSATWYPRWLSPISGPEHHGDIELPVEEQLRWLEQLGDVYLRIESAALNALMTMLQERPELSPNVKGVLLRGEMASDDLRQLCRRYLHCEIIDSYWRPEAGTIALRCPSADLYHLQSETCLVEVIDRDGRLCEAGQAGEIVITPLYAYAMPLVRYRTGDVAELPSSNFSLIERCACGRGLPAIKQVLRSNS